jgi:hypothetical protein
MKDADRGLGTCSVSVRFLFVCCTVGVRLEGTITCFPLQLNRTSFTHTSHSFLLPAIIHMMGVKPRTVHIRTERVVLSATFLNY